MNNAEPFGTSIEEAEGNIIGPMRRPQQMLAVQEVGNNASIHDDATAQAIGFSGGTIEGPTHFSQFAPLGYAIWGDRWLTNGCISAHYRAPAFEGDPVSAQIKKPSSGIDVAEIRMVRDDGTEILQGSASVGPGFPISALERRLNTLSPLTDPVILADLELGAKTQRTRVQMGFEQHMGPLYPFTLTDKLDRITEMTPAYRESRHGFAGPIIPMEMISVLMQYTSLEDSFETKGPVVGLFADQEIRLHGEPLFVGKEYELDRELVFLSGSRRTESMWIRTKLYTPSTNHVVAEMLLNMASFKNTYPPYETEYAERYKG